MILKMTQKGENKLLKYRIFNYQETKSDPKRYIDGHAKVVDPKRCSRISFPNNFSFSLCLQAINSSNCFSTNTVLLYSWVPERRRSTLQWSMLRLLSNPTIVARTAISHTKQNPTTATTSKSSRTSTTRNNPTNFYDVHYRTVTRSSTGCKS